MDTLAPYEQASDFDPRVLKGRAAEVYRQQPFQHRVWDWLKFTFTKTICTSIEERCDRFVEEAIEFVQSLGYDKRRILALVDYVYGRDVGEPKQELGGVMVTLAALSGTAELDMQDAGEVELKRVWAIVEKIRAKDAGKRKGSALPGPSTPGHNCVTRLVETRLASVRFMYFDGGWVLYQCLRTDDEFKSRNYVARDFTASNGVRILTKNSPILIDDSTLALHGSFVEFDTKPTLLTVAGRAEFDSLVERITAALTEMDEQTFPAIIGSVQD